MGSDDVGGMTQKEMLIQLYQWKKESIENDARFKVQVEELVKRFDQQEESFEKISEELISQRNFFTAIESMNEKFSDMGKKLAEIIEWKHEQEKLNLLEQRDNKAIDEKFDRLFGWKDKTSGRLDALENKSAKATFALVKKIGGIVLTMIVTAITAYLIGRIK
jgi:hypothetical protein|nr:MAG TPA: hypothetical protein [Caudoviricetes sp.]